MTGKNSTRYINSPAITMMLPDGINVSIDPVADVLYIKLLESEIARSKEERPGILVDLDKHNRLVGISIVNPKQVSLARRTVIRKIAARFHIPSLGRIYPEHLARGYAYA